MDVDDVVFCAYIFGSDWEDIKYFQDTRLALDALRAYVRRSERTDCSVLFYHGFHPFVVSFRRGNDGTMHEKDVWKIGEQGEILKSTASQE